MFNVADAVACLEEAGLVLEKGCFDGHRTIQRIQVDHRQAGAEDLFIAYKGVSFDSHTVLEQVWGLKGPLVILEDSRCLEDLEDEPYLLVKSARDAWGYLEALAWGNPQKELELLAVTGTNGKTSSSWLLKDLLAPLGQHVFVIGTMGAFFQDQTFETGHTTPDPGELFGLLRRAVDAGASCVIMEVSSHALAQNKLGPIRFEGALFTSFSRDHLDFHRDMDQYFSAKMTLFEEYLRPNALAVFNDSLKQKLGTLEEGWVYYGQSSNSEWQMKIHQRTLRGAVVSIKNHDRQWDLEVPLVGDFILENLLGVMALSYKRWQGQDLGSLCRSLGTVPGRLERVSPEGGCQVFVDYAHTPDALRAAISAIKPMVPGCLLVVFGCGGDRDRGKRRLMGELASRFSDQVFITSDNPRSEDPEQIINDILEGVAADAPCEVSVIIDRRQAIETAISLAEPSDCVLIAGKGHEDYQIVGKEKLFFDDRLFARHVMEKKSKSD